MTVGVYALAKPGAGRISATGLAGERLHVFRVGHVAAIVGRPSRRLAPTESNLRRYDRLLRTLWEDRSSLLPVRFGTLMDDAELEAVLRVRQASVRRQLAHVRGRGQMTVRVAGTSPPEARPVSGSRGGPGKVRPTGAQYLAARRRAQEVPAFAPLRRAVSRWVRDERVERRGPVATMYHLVARGAAPRYLTALRRAAAAAGLQVTVSGPWPAYAFADEW